MPAVVKQRRLEELIAVFREEATKLNTELIGTDQIVLVEGVSRINYRSWRCEPCNIKNSCKNKLLLKLLRKFPRIF